MLCYVTGFGVPLSTQLPAAIVPPPLAYAVLIVCATVARCYFSVTLQLSGGILRSPSSVGPARPMRRRAGAPFVGSLSVSDTIGSPDSSRLHGSAEVGSTRQPNGRSYPVKVMSAELPPQRELGLGEATAVGIVKRGTASPLVATLSVDSREEFVSPDEASGSMLFDVSPVAGDASMAMSVHYSGSCVGEGGVQAPVPPATGVAGQSEVPVGLSRVAPSRRTPLLAPLVASHVDLDGTSADDGLLSSLMTPLTPVRSAPLLFDAGMTRPRSQSRRLGESPLSTPSLSVHGHSPRASPLLLPKSEGIAAQGSPRLTRLTTTLSPSSSGPLTCTGAVRVGARLGDDAPPRMLSVRGATAGPGSRLFSGNLARVPAAVNPSRLRVAQEVVGELGETTEMVAPGADAGTGSGSGSGDAGPSGDGGTGAQSSRVDDSAAAPAAAVVGTVVTEHFPEGSGVRPVSALSRNASPRSVEAETVSELLDVPKYPLRVIYAAGETFKVRASFSLGGRGGGVG
jgi:hypothetical protein